MEPPILRDLRDMDSLHAMDKPCTCPQMTLAGKDRGWARPMVSNSVWSHRLFCTGHYYLGTEFCPSVVRNLEVVRISVD